MIDKPTAIEIAKQIAANQNWPWVEPIAVDSRRAWFIGAKCWRIVSNCTSKGSNVVILIDAHDGQVKKADYLPR